MNPLDTSPQPIHQMALVLFVLAFVLLAAFALLGRVVNWLAKKPLVNGAYIAFFALLLSIVALTGLSLFHPSISLRGSRILGQSTAALVPATAIAFYLGRRASRKSKLAAKQVAPALASGQEE